MSADIGQPLGMRPFSRDTPQRKLRLENKQPIGNPIGPLRCREPDLADVQEDKMPQLANHLNDHVLRGRGQIRDPLHMQLLGRNPIVTLARQSG